MRINENTQVTIHWGFLWLFLVYTGILTGMAELASNAMPAFREFTASAIAALWRLLSVPVDFAGTQLTFVGFPMEIVLECTALHYMIIFVAGVMAFRSHTLSYRIAGVIIGAMAIFLLNIARIGIIGFIGRYFNSIFAFVHEYLWQGMFALSIVLLWVNGKKGFSRKLTFRLLIVSLSATLSFWLVATFQEAYVSLLAFLSNIMFPLLSLFVDVPQRVIENGRLIGYVVGDEVTFSETTLYILNSALLLPIASITFVRSEWKIFMKRFSAAVILLGAQHMLIIALDWLLEVIQGPGIQSVLIWSIVMSTFIAPMIIWLTVMNIIREKPADDRSYSE